MLSYTILSLLCDAQLSDVIVIHIAHYEPTVYSVLFHYTCTIIDNTVYNSVKCFVNYIQYLLLLLVVIHKDTLLIGL